MCSKIDNWNKYFQASWKIESIKERNYISWKKFCYKKIISECLEELSDGKADGYRLIFLNRTYKCHGVFEKGRLKRAILQSDINQWNAGAIHRSTKITVALWGVLLLAVAVICDLPCSCTAAFSRTVLLRSSLVITHEINISISYNLILLSLLSQFTVNWLTINR